MCVLTFFNFHFFACRFLLNNFFSHFSGSLRGICVKCECTNNTNVFISALSGNRFRAHSCAYLTDFFFSFINSFLLFQFSLHFASIVRSYAVKSHRSRANCTRLLILLVFRIFTAKNGWTLRRVIAGYNKKLHNFRSRYQSPKSAQTRTKMSRHRFKDGYTHLLYIYLFRIKEILLLLPSPKPFFFSSLLLCEVKELKPLESEHWKRSDRNEIQTKTQQFEFLFSHFFCWLGEERKSEKGKHGEWERLHTNTGAHLIQTGVIKLV